MPARPAREAPRLFEVWADNWRTVQCFIRLRRQWSVVASGMAIYHQGIRVEAIESVLRTARVPAAEQEEVMDDLLMMSDVAAEIYNKR